MKNVTFNKSWTSLGFVCKKITANKGGVRCIQRWMFQCIYSAGMGEEV
jgi:hypothetical protein